MDHDQRFKTLPKAFLAEFIQTFFPAWADRFDFLRVDRLEQEVFTDPPRGERRSLDLVLQVPLRPGVPPPPAHPYRDRVPGHSTLDEAQAQQWAALMRAGRYEGVQAMALTTFEKGLQQGQRRTLRELGLED